jgi:glycosyltransferase involved in cell wall biosynthesis
MVVVNIIMPCYNAGEFLQRSVQSVIDQTFTQWELIIVNDGSTDGSESVAQTYASRDSRIRVITKANGGYVSARLFGYASINAPGRYVIFYDADDILHPDMLEELTSVLESDPLVGAAYCDHRIMDEHDGIRPVSIDMPRYVPTRFGVKKISDNVPETPFISIFCWTKMIEPMTLIRRETYDQTRGWDIDFGRGQGNIGEGVYLFSEIALRWKVIFVNKPLYYYRRHSQQMSATSSGVMHRQAEKVINKWRQRLREGFPFKERVELAIVFMLYRLSAYRRVGSLKFQLKHKPGTFFYTIVMIVIDYARSLKLITCFKKLQ